MDSGLKVPELLTRLRGNGPHRPSPVIAIVAAHPDDEIIGSGAQLSTWPGAEFIEVTDGAPRDLQDARTAGFKERREYAAARQRELRQALLMAGHGHKSLYQLGLADQEASWAMAELAHSLVTIFQRLRPEMVLTHPYEGGHPDHDATAFAVHAASGLLQKYHYWQPTLLEMTSYHNRAGQMESGDFISHRDTPVTTFVLSAPQIQFKRRLFECFITQRRVLAGFKIEHERFRPAPRYDFLGPPHEGVLYYEMFRWGMSGDQWRTLARRALTELDLTTPARAGLGGGAVCVNDS